MGETSYGMSDINKINETVDQALADINTKITSLEATAANTGLGGTAAEALLKTLEEQKAKIEAAKEKINAAKTEAEEKIASENNKWNKIDSIANS